MLDGLSVGIIRPPELAYMRQLEALHDDNPNVHDERWVESAERIIGEIREALAEAADRHDRAISFTEHQAHQHDRFAVPVGKRARLVAMHDVLVAIDPTPSQFNFVSRPRPRFPLQRSLVAFSDRNTLVDHSTFLGSVSVPLVGGKVRSRIQRIFAVHTPLHEDDSLDALRRQTAVFDHVVRYPDVPAMAAQPLEITPVGSDHFLALPEARSLLQE